MDSFLEICEAVARNPGTTGRETYAAIQKTRIETARAKEDAGRLHPFEDASARALREIAESGTPRAGAVPFRATFGEIELAKARHPGATEPALIAAIREARAHEAAARSPKAAHGRPVERPISEIRG